MSALHGHMFSITQGKSLHATKTGIDVIFMQNNTLVRTKVNAQTLQLRSAFMHAKFCKIIQTSYPFSYAKHYKIVHHLLFAIFIYAKHYKTVRQLSFAKPGVIWNIV
jgi:hypothetical protein